MSDPECHEIPAEREERASRRLARLCRRQRGFVTAKQLGRCGYSTSAIGRLVEDETLARHHQGVYRKGDGPLPPFGREQAALLAIEEGTLSFESAAHLWGWGPSISPVHVTAPRRARPRPGLRPHFSLLPAHQVRERYGLRVTSPARTLLDCASVPPAERLERYVAEALRRRQCTEADLRRVLAEHPRARGSRALKKLLGEGPRPTRSEAERIALRALRRAGVEPPEVNVRRDGAELDLSWPRHRLVVEIDGFQWHGDRLAFENDRRRDQDLLVEGWRVLRFTWRQLTEEPERFAAVVRRALGSGERPS